MLLAIDTSTAQVGLALYDGHQILGEMTWTTKQHHTTELSPAVLGLLARSSIKMDMISGLGIAIGPGSFTSLRVGLALAKGIALARHIPTIGIPTLDIIAAAQPLETLPLVAVLQAGRKRIAVGEYENSGERWQFKGQIRGTTVDELAESLTTPTMIAGELSPAERQNLARNKHIHVAPPLRAIRRPSILADLAWARLQAGDVDNAAALAPIYLHVEGTPIA